MNPFAEFAGADSLTMGQTLLVSLSGMAVVLLELILIALMIWAMAKIVNAIAEKAGAKPAAQTAAGPVVDTGEEETIAVIIAAVSEESDIPLDQMEVRSIQQL